MKNIIKDEILISLKSMTKLKFYLSINAGNCKDNLSPGIQYHLYNYIVVYVMTNVSTLLFKRDFKVCTATFACLQKRKKKLNKSFLGHCMSEWNYCLLSLFKISSFFFCLFFFSSWICWGGHQLSRWSESEAGKHRFHISGTECCEHPKKKQTRKRF